MPLPRSSRTVSRPLALFLAVASTGVAFLPGVASADDVYYFGGGFTDNWSNPLNWNGAAVPAQYDNLLFRGALRSQSTINERREYGDLRFLPDPGDISASYEFFGSAHTSTLFSDYGVWDSRFNTILNATKSSQQFNATVANTYRVLTIDNATARSDAGAINFKTIALVPGNVIGPGGTTDRNLTVAFKPGANGIVVNNLTVIANDQRGLATIDGPGYVSVRGKSINYDYQVKQGTLSLGLEPVNPDLYGDSTLFTLNAGTTLDLDSGNGPVQSKQWIISATSGQAAINVDADLSVYLSNTTLTGTFAKTGSGKLELASAASGTSFAVQGGQMVMSNRQVNSTLTGLSVASGTTFEVANGTEVYTPTPTGTGSISLNSARLTLTPTTATQLDARITGSGFLRVAAPGGLVDVRAINAYTGGTRVDAGTLVVSSAFGGLGSGDVEVLGGTLAGTGRVSGKVFVKQGGTIAPSRADTPGLNTGTFTVAGLHLTAGGNVAIEFNGINQGTQVDLLAVNNGGAFGDANITNGTLSLSRGTNFFPASGKFPKVSILKTGTSGSLAGVFARVNGVRVNDSYSFAVTYDAQNVYAQLADVSDTNLDNVQNYLDVYALASNYKTGVANQVWLSGDLSGDGLVNYTDLLLANSYVPRLTQAQFDGLLSRSYALWYDYGVLQGYSVPEPTSLAVVSLAGLFLGRRRRAASGV